MSGLAFRDTRAAFEAPGALTRFARFDVVCEGWYCVGRSKDVPPRGTRKVWIGERDLVLWRDAKGGLHAIARACPHLGADLSKGAVTDKGLRCAFHHWCWDGEGACAAGGGVPERRRARAYEARDRWGLAWVWAGDGPPKYGLPSPAPENERHVVRLPPQRLDCHPHVMLGNGLDFTHVGPVHGFRFDEDPKVDLQPPHALAVDIHARFAPTWSRRLLGIADKTARWRFTCIGPTLAWVKVESPTPFELLWAGRPLPGGGTAAQTVFFLPRRRAMVRAIPTMIATTWADRHVLDGVDLQPGFVESDGVFAMYARMMEGISTWTA